MVILRQATIKYKGYDPDTLKLKSNKRICCSCDICGKVRYVNYCAYRDLCHGCSMIGKNEGQKRSKVFKQKMSIIRKQWHKDNSDILKGENNPMFNKIVSQKTRQKISDANMSKKRTDECKQKQSKSKIGKLNPMFGIHLCGELNGNWKGGYDQNRSHLTPVKQCLKLNTKFPGSEGHHIMSGVIVFIPKDLHRLISHNFKTGKNMDEINALAIQFISGGL